MITSEKELLAHIIKHNGDCHLLLYYKHCDSFCPFAHEDIIRCKYDHSEQYKCAVEFFIELYGKEELLEVLL